MAYFYIESTGTRTSGGGQTKKTGAWSSIAVGDKYADPADCAGDASPPVDGDVVCWRADDTQNLTANGDATFADGVFLVATSAADCDVFEKATADMLTTNTGVRSWLLPTSDSPKALVVRGVSWSEDQYLYVYDAKKIRWSEVHKGCLDTTIIYVRYGGLLVGIDSELDGPDSGTADSIFVIQGGTVVLKGGAVSAASASSVPCVGFGSNGAYGFIFAADCSNRTTGSAICEVGSVTDKLGLACFVKNALPTSWTVEGIANTHAAHVIVENCDSRYQYEQIGYSGDISFVTDVYYTSHSTMDDGSTKGSLYFDANADCSPYAPLKYGDYSSGRWLMKDNQSAATLNTLRVFFVTHSADSIDKGDVQIECMYADTADTSKVLFAKHINPIINDSPGALSTETTSSVWTDTGSNSLATTSYYFDLDLTSEGNGLVYWTLALTKADVEMWLSWECEFV